METRMLGNDLTVTAFALVVWDFLMDTENRLMLMKL